MPKKIHPASLSISADNYFNILKTSFFNPFSFRQVDFASASFFACTFFFLINCLLASLVYVLTAAFGLKRFSLVFIGMGQSLVLLPVALGAALVLSLYIFALARVLGGKGSLRATFKALCLGSGPLVLISVPGVNIIASLLALYLLLINIATVHQYSLVRSFCTLLIPILIGLFLRMAFLP